MPTILPRYTPFSGDLTSIWPVWKFQDSNMYSSLNFSNHQVCFQETESFWKSDGIQLVVKNLERVRIKNINLNG